MARKRCKDVKTVKFSLTIRINKISMLSWSCKVCKTKIKMKSETGRNKVMGNSEMEIKQTLKKHRR